MRKDWPGSKEYVLLEKNASKETFWDSAYAPNVSWAWWGDSRHEKILQNRMENE